jgi:phosphatidylglycerol lysyltransferase
MVDTASHGVGIFKKLPDTHDTGTLAKNNLGYWLMTFGNETWHNVHHAYPKAADNGNRWYQWDLDSFLMKTMARLGLVSGLQFVPASARFRVPAGSRYFAHQSAMPQELVQALERASVEHGDAYDSYLVNEPNREYLVACEGRAFVSFVTRGRFGNVVGGLLAAATDKDAMLATLQDFAKLNKLTVSVFSVAERELPRFRAAGFQLTRFGQDFVIDLRTTDWKGSRYEWVRRQTNFVRRANVALTEERRSAHTPESWQALIADLESLESELLATKAQGRPTGTFQGRLDGGALGRRRLFVARAPSGRAEGFIVCNPYDGCRRWAVEIFRHRPDAVRGAAPALIHAAALAFQSEGVEALSLSIIPGVGCETPLPGDSALSRNLMVFWSRWLNVVSDLRGVYHFKTRFRPRLECVYVAVQPKATLGSIHAFLMTWGIMKVHPLRMARVALRMLSRRGDRANLVDPQAAAAAMEATPA